MIIEKVFSEELLGRKLEKIGLEVIGTQVKSILIFIGSKVIKVNGIYGSEQIQLTFKQRNIDCISRSEVEKNKYKYIFGLHGKALKDIKVVGTIPNCKGLELIFDGDATAQIIINAKKLDDFSNFFDGSLNIIENKRFREYKEKASRHVVKSVIDSWEHIGIMERKDDEYRPEIEAILTLVATKSDVYEIAKGIKEIFRYYFGESVMNCDVNEYLDVAVELDKRTS